MDLRISELAELSSLNDDDYIVFQRNTSTGKQSYKMSFKNLKTQFQEKFSTLGVGSAAYCNAIQFAPFAHGHDYSDVWYFPSYGPESHNPVDANRSALCCINNGTFDIVTYQPGIGKKTKTTINVWQPPLSSILFNDVSAYASKHMHKVGDVQMCAAKNFSTYLTAYRKYRITSGNIDINISPSDASHVFDGFVIPNGQTFSCAYNKFKAACKAYSANRNENATSFTVPNLLNTFFKCDPGLPVSQMRPLASNPSTNGMPSHTHNGRMMSSSSSYSLELPAMQLSLRGTQDIVHRTDGSHDPQFSNSIGAGELGRACTISQSLSNYNDVHPKIVALNLTCDMQNASCTLAGEGGDVYPSHSNLLPLLYIGMPDD